ncbi:MAG: M20/M25/M40 family metallo-hydrolase [Candidatus Angelobacter sp.]
MYRDRSFENAIAFAHDLVRIPSISGDEGAVAARVMSEFKLLGFDETWSDEIGNVFALLKGRGQAGAVMMSSHLDVVDAGDTSQWEYQPFEGLIAENCLHGRGAVDCKGPLALQTYAAATLRDSRPAGDVYVVHTVLEECGSWGMAHAMEQLSDRIGAVVLGEATQGDICIGHRGRIELMITIRGASAHASAPERGRHPAQLLPDVLAALQKFCGQLPSHAVLPRATVVPTVIETWPKNRNMVPEEVRVLVDWRALSTGRKDSAVEGIRRFLLAELHETSGFKVTVEEVCTRQRAYTGWEREMPISTHGFLTDESHAVVDAAVHAVREVTGRVPRIRPWTFGTDGGYPCGVHGIPTIGYAPGNEDCSHTNWERLDLDSARVAFQVYPVLIKQLQEELEDALQPQAVGAQDHLFLKRLKRQ